jgi:RsiW-degrading membrane proteinase PrsW (M82 family)
MHIILLSLVPCLLWLYFFWSRETSNRQQVRPLVRAFAYGAAASLAAGIVEYFVPGINRVGVWCYFFLLIAPLEELCKYLATSWFISREPTFDKPSDGLIFAAAAALGFAFVENIQYFATEHASFGLMHSLIYRSLFSIPSHVLDTAPWGAALGYARLLKGTPRLLVPAGLLLASFMHGLFDTIALINGEGRMNGWFAILAITVLLMTQWEIFRYLRNRAVRDWRNIRPAAQPLTSSSNRSDVTDRNLTSD